MGNGSGSAVNGAYYNWGGTSDGSPNEPDDFASNQDAAAICLTGWPYGTTFLGSASEWNDIAISNTLYFIVEYDNSSIDYNDSNTGINVYPNPATNMLFVNSNRNLSEIRIKNIYGEEILVQYPETVNSVIKFDIPPGIYFVETYMNNGNKQTHKIVIAK